MLAIHGHGPGKARICGVDRRGPHDEGPAYAHVLASEGYVVLAPDLRGFGERSRLDARRQVPLRLGSRVRDDGRRRSARSAISGTSSVRSTCSTRIRSSTPTASAAAGLSYGATCTLFLAAIDDRVRAAIVSGYLSSWRSAHTVPWNMCGSQILPGQLGAIEHLDIASLIAPRPLLVENGTDDIIFPVDAARDDRRAVAARLRQLGAPADARRARRVRRRPSLARHRDPTFLERWL